MIIGRGMGAAHAAFLLYLGFIEISIERIKRILYVASPIDPFVSASRPNGPVISRSLLISATRGVENREGLTSCSAEVGIEAQNVPRTNLRLGNIVLQSMGRHLGS